jgi:Fic-DOC domain mobile mystery protein B
MTDPLVPIGDGQTAVSEEERAVLIPTDVATRGELFTAEEANIASGTLNLNPTVAALLDDLFLRRLHRRMFDQVWTWAGQYRTRETNIGIAPTQIPTAVVDLVRNTQTWIDASTFEPDVIALRFHHRLVQIHAFVNGNGRHGRIAADLLARALGRPTFTWGRRLTVTTTELRARYIAALRVADANAEDIEELAVFSRS